jgi:hypothetical protein
MEKDKIIYSISIEDIYEVAQDVLDRKPTKDELKFVENKIGDRIAWYYIIESLLDEFEYESKQK